MNPEIWGSHAWIFLHTITLNYPKNPTLYDKKVYKNFFENLDKILPCTWCAHNYRIHMKKYPIQHYLGTKKNLVKWLIIMHNEVNKILKKNTINYEEFLYIYKDLYKQNESCNLYIIIPIIIIIIIITCSFIYFNQSKFQSYFQIQ